MSLVSVAFTLGVERYRYPANLPKVAAKGGPQCNGRPARTSASSNARRIVVADIGANPGSTETRASC